MKKQYVARSLQQCAFTTLVALICLLCLQIRLASAQEVGPEVVNSSTNPLPLDAQPTTDPPTLRDVLNLMKPPPPPVVQSNADPAIVTPINPPPPVVSSTATEPTNVSPTGEPANARPTKNRNTPQNINALGSSMNPTFKKHKLRSDSDNQTVLCKDGLLLRAWQPLTDISQTERIVRGIVYFLAMCYLFIGVSIASDRFMESIEVITSSEKRVSVLNKNGQKETISVRVWSATVANLTLMALGSSAPEILLSVIEMFQKNFDAGDLGPGTIVGSAAYNLFIIIAICIVVIPKGQVRRINDFRVFVVTALWSIFAYIWMCLITKYITPNVIDIWEGLLTFCFFPILVCHAYITKRRLFCPGLYKKSNETNQQDDVVSRLRSSTISKDALRTSIKDLADSPEMREFEDTRREYIIKLKELRRRYPQYDLEKIQAMAQKHIIRRRPKSRAFYRIHSGRRLTGASDVWKKARDYAAMEIGEAKAEIRLQAEEGEELYDDFETRLYFEPAHYTVLESVGDVELHVMRAGSLKHLTKVEYYTEDGTAEAGSDYVAAHGVLEFAPGSEEQTILIHIIDDDIFEEDEHFYVHLKNPSVDAVIATPKVATIMILDDDHCGIFGFTETEHRIPETVNIYEIEIKRFSGARCRVIVPYYTQEKTAISGKEYMNVKGELVFEHGEVVRTIEIKIIEEHSFEKDAIFEVHLGQPTVAKDDPLHTKINEVKQKRVEERTREEKILLSGMPKLADGISKIECHIVESEEFKQTVNKLVQTANASKLIGTTSWREQFMDALTVSGGGNFEGYDDENGDEDGDDEKEVEDGSGPGVGEYFMHFISIFWKICFAIIPPSKLYNGYPTFTIAMFLIGICTAVLADVASHFGCTLGVLDSVTAICFVALGTSLPDTFASKVAAIHDKTADNAIGNVTGSNAVNVFLGIGIAWSMAAIYHACHGNKFVVPVGSLIFSTTLFLIEASIAFIIIIFRRKKSIGGELGGPVKLKWFHCSVFILLWITYVTISTLEAYHIIPGF